MMKQRDISVAAALLIHGYLAANNALVLNQGDAFEGNRKQLRDALAGVRQECDDWAENLWPGGADANAVDASSLTVLLHAFGGAVANRSPQNLITGAVELVAEAVDLLGPEAIIHFQKQLSGRAQIVGAVKASEKPPARPADQTALLIEAADQLVAEIDASTERPTAMLTAWDVLTEKLRAAGVNVEESCLAPSNW